MRLIPERWRDAVARDLREEAARRGKGRLWQTWHALRIAAALRLRPAQRHSAAISPFPQSSMPSFSWRPMMRNLSTDIRQAVRQIRKQPWSTTAIVATLAIGIGASTAVYAVFNYALFRPVPGIPDEAPLVSVYVRPDLRTPAYTTATHAHLQAMRAMPALAGLAGYRTTSYPLQVGGGDPRMLSVTSVSLGYFDLLGVEAVAGRFFANDEYERPGAALAVISERLWRSALNADPRAVGGSIHIIGKPFTVIGVARGFRGLERVDDEDVWVPRGADTLLRSVAPTGYRWDRMVGRLAPGATLAVAREQAAAAFERVGVKEGSGDRTYTAVVYAGLTDGFGVAEASMTVLFRLAMAGSALLLVLACANAAGMLLSRNLRRQRDFALKAAFGASRARVIRELLVEVGLVSLLAAGGGLLVASVLAGLFRSERLVSSPLEDLALDWRVGLFAAAVAAATILLAGLIPAVLAARSDPQAGLRAFARGASRSGRLRQTLTAVQVALSLALVASAGVLAESAARLQSVDLGFDPARLLNVSLAPTLVVGRGNARAFLGEVEARLSAAPGIETVGFSSPAQLGSYRRTELTRSPEAAVEPGTMRNVSSDYFRAMRIPLVAGRAFTATEALEGEGGGPVVVDEIVAQRLFGDTHAVGRTLYVRRRGALERRHIVGIVGSTANSLDDARRPTVYLPAGDLRAANFQIRSALPPADAMATIRRVVREIEPLLALDSIQTTESQIDHLAAQERVQARLGLVLAALALGLAIAGVFAAVAGGVQERTREFGIRMALGASRSAVGRDVLRRAAVMTGVGLAGGLALYAWGSRFIESQLFGVSALDPLTIAGACAVLLSSALLAAWLPARRATRVDPTIALRAE